MVCVARYLSKVPLLVMVFISSRSALESQRAAPVRRVFASANGEYTAEVTIDRKLSPRTATLVLTQYSDSGDAITKWHSSLDYIPDRVLLSDEGHVVALDEYVHQGFEHTLVVFNKSGVIQKSYNSLEEIVPADDVKKHVPVSLHSRHWTVNACFRFSKDRLMISTRWGTDILVDLESGRVETD